jgi:hypothetical protein
MLSVFDLRVEDDREMWSGKSMAEYVRPTA